MKSFDKASYVPQGLPEDSKIEGDVVGFFSAVYALDKDKVEVILTERRIDVNSVTNFGQIKVSGRPDEHMRQIFDSLMCGKITCQLFEKIDQEDNADNIFVLLQV